VGRSFFFVQTASYKVNAKLNEFHLVSLANAPGKRLLVTVELQVIPSENGIFPGALRQHKQEQVSGNGIVRSTNPDCCLLWLPVVFWLPQQLMVLGFQDYYGARDVRSKQHKVHSYS
jgi:hypothetical protein